jgi:CHAT domain-containing protein/tetratricopeptide (TPR) repeat protein
LFLLLLAFGTGVPVFAQGKEWKTLNDEVMSLYQQGLYYRAIVVANKALEVAEQAVDPNHASVATSLNNLAALYRAQGQYAQAEPLCKRALAISEKTLGPNHPNVERDLNNLAELYRAQGQYAQAEPLYKRALAISEKALGPDHPVVASGLNHLAALYRAQGQYAQAEPLFQRSLAISEKALGPDHPDVAMILNNLAALYDAQGQYAQGEPLLKRSLAINEKALGLEHPQVARILDNLAQCYQATGQSRDALMSLSRGLGIEQANMGRLFDVSSEPAMRDYLATTNSSLEALLSLAKESAEVWPEAADSAFAWTLRRKAVILETLIRFREAQRLESEDPAVARRTGELRGLRERLNRLVVSPGGKGNLAGVDSQIVSLREECDRSEAELNRLLSERLPKGVAQNVDLETVRRSLPKGSALVELVRTNLFDFHASGAGSRWKAAHYFAFVLTPEENARPSMVDLGDAEEIDRHVREVRESLQHGYASRGIGGLTTAQGAESQERKSAPTPEMDFRSKSQELYRLVFAPLRKALGAAQTIYLAPDGELNRVPFEALVDEHGKYLIETYRIAYLTSGKELLEPATKRAHGTVIFAAPDYNLRVRERKAEAGSLLASAPAQGESAFRGSRSVEVRGWGGWSALPGTAREGAEVKRELEGSGYGPVRMYAGKEALEEVLKALPAPRVLHVATHGYFFADQTLPSKSAEQFLAGADPFGREQRLARIRGTENPLLRSGLLLAGANASGAEGDSLGVEDGWVTAEEVGMLDLHGTELVVLSACDTGLGDVRSGEGVSGLRRAFRYAGVRTVVMSLFQVDDDATRDLMGRFYRGLKGGSGKLDALHQAQLDVMQERRNRGGTAHPFYWASFVLAGDPN